MISYYRNKGYDFNYGDEIEISVNDLPSSSTIKVECACDYCNDIIYPRYTDYLRVLAQPLPKLACTNCVGKKTKESNMIVYGVESVSQLDSVKRKIKKTCVDKYGSSSYLATSQCREELKEYCLQNYGTTNPSSSPIIREKMKNTMLQKYNVSLYSKSPEFKQKVQEVWKNKTIEELKDIKNRREETSLKNWGYRNPMKNNKVKQKFQDSLLNTYGVTSPSKSEDIQYKMRETLYKNQTVPTSSQQLYIYNLYGGELNYPVKKYNLDICILSDMIDIEYDGRGHQMMVNRGELSQAEFDQKELIRDKQIKSEGYRIMRIISRKDYLPSDTTLLNMLQYARDFFTSNPKRSWISFDIDNKVIYNAYHKESELGLPYDYGKLRKIKNLDKKIIRKEEYTIGR